MTEIRKLDKSVKFVEDLLCLAFPPGLPAEKGTLVTLAVYLDASHPTDAIPALFVAGAISTRERWEAFSEEWYAALYDFERLPYFHMSEFETGIGIYEDWKERGVKKPRFDRLLKIMEKYIGGSIGASITLELCAKHYSKPPIEVAYGLAGSQCFLTMADLYREGGTPDEEIVYTFEQGDQGRGKLETIYDQIYTNEAARKQARWPLGSKLVVEKKKFPPLQAADILAYEGWKQWSREFGNEKTRGPRYSYTQLRAAFLDTTVNIDESYLQNRDIPVKEKQA